MTIFGNGENGGKKEIRTYIFENTANIGRNHEEWHIFCIHDFLQLVNALNYVRRTKNSNEFTTYNYNNNNKTFKQH